MLTRLNKFISDTGTCSRRQADQLIEAGRVLVNGIAPVLGTKVSAEDLITIDGKTLKLKPATIYIAFNKPIGITSTTDLKDKHNIIDYLKHPERIFPIGRLDKPSEGLIFLTNDGDIVNKILRAGNQHEKEYVVTVDKPITPDFLNKMGNGVTILDTITKKCFIEQLTKNTFRIILTQGLNRQIRRMCDTLEYKVTKLKRIRIMNITLNGLAAGEWRYLTAAEIGTINQLVENSKKTEEASYDTED